LFLDANLNILNTYFSTVPTSRKIISFIFCVLFVWSAVIQLNDPDPYHWFAIYLLVAIIHVVLLFRPLSKKLLWVVIVGLLVYSFYHFAHFMDWLQIENKAEIFGEMVYDKPYLEGTREFLGLLICALSLFYPLKKST
jgi:branched-subunit amino acid transport protein